MPDSSPRPQVNTSMASAARLYDAYQNGKNGYQVDHDIAEEVQKHLDMAQIAPANRAFRDRAIRYVTDELGISQLLDIGTGMPQDPNTHQIAQEIQPGARVVYVDNDPVVMRHAEALLHSSPGGVTDYIHADLRDPQAILAAARQTLDFDKPVAVLLVAVLHFVLDDERDSRAITKELLAPLVPGSCLILTHGTDEFEPEACRAMEAIYREQGIGLELRSRAAISRIVDGLDLVPPGLVEIHQWRPDTETDPAKHLHCYGVVGIKPAA